MLEILNTLVFLLPKVTWHIGNSYIAFLPIFGLLHAAVLCFVRRKFLCVSFLLLFIVIYHFLFFPLLKVLPYLGVDSFVEVNGFETKEALFWVYTLLFSPAYSAKVYFLWTIVFVFYVVAIIAFRSLFFRFSNEGTKTARKSYQNLFIILLIFLPITVELTRLPSLFFNVAKTRDEIQQKFSNDNNWVNAKKMENGISVLLYIGESTSKMHMQAYGYPRNTTEKIVDFAQSNENFLVVNNVLSTHTHTVASLLDALSVKKSYDKKPTLFQEKSLISIVDVLADVGIPTGVISNNVGVGSNERLFSTIFRNADYSFKPIGYTKKYDSDFFDENYKELSERYAKKRSLKIFHSYAGHGPYLENIPKEFRRPVDDLFLNVDPRAVLGKHGFEYGVNKYVEAYDSAIKYVDYSVANALEEVKNEDEPTVMIYFSDHGESAFTQRGHDSSRFVVEMMTVPMFVYFNDAAAKQNASLLQDIKERAKSNDLATLSELSYLILELIGVEVEYLSSSESNNTPCKMFNPLCTQNYILVRDLGNRIGAIEIGADSQSSSQFFDDLSDDALRHKITRNQLKLDYPDLGICYHRSNSMAKVIRGTTISNCIEIDLVVHNGEINIYHPPAPNVGFSFDTFLHLISGWSGTVWIDAKNISDPDACEHLVNSLSRIDKQNVKFMLEFPSNTDTKNPLLANCFKKIKSYSIVASYYIPKRIGRACDEEKLQSKIINNEFICIRLDNLLKGLLENPIFSNISFDVELLGWVMGSSLSKNFRWNSWHVTEEHLPVLPKHSYNNIILINNDPNGI